MQEPLTVLGERGRLPCWPACHASRTPRFRSQGVVGKGYGKVSTAISTPATPSSVSIRRLESRSDPLGTP
ncbi:hypothetical protein [Deinococcus aquaticus]|uniref:hypothetical protein n=1 Tax=Deinococcus aquaticus TaxID=328692 RepID=UPI00360729F9